MWAVIVRWENTELGWLAGICFFTSLVGPFIGYILALYDAPMFSSLSRVVRMVCLTLLSIGATFGGTILIFVLFVILGVPLRH